MLLTMAAIALAGSIWPSINLFGHIDRKVERKPSNQLTLRSRIFAFFLLVLTAISARISFAFQGQQLFSDFLPFIVIFVAYGAFTAALKRNRGHY